MTDVFMKILGMSVTACVIIAVVLLLRLALIKAPKIFSYILWAAVFFRLLCPFTFELPAPIGVTPVQMQTRDVGEFITPTAEQDIIGDTRPPIPAVKREEASIIFVTAEKERGEDLVYTKNKTGLDIIAAVWTAGAAAMALYGIISYIRLRMRLKGARAEDGFYVCERISNPFIFGIFRPRIYLPDGLSDGQRGFILLHEKAHIRRLDHIVKIVMYAALCLHWFNPLVWLSFRLCEKDMEMSVDQRVTADMQPDQKADYSQTLLSVTTARTAAFTACFGENNIKQRVKNVLYYKKPALWIIIVCVVGLVAAMVIMMTNAPSAKGEEAVESEPAVTSAQETEPPDAQVQGSALFLTASDKKALDLFGAFGYYADEDGMLHIDENALTVSHDYDMFRKYFFGTWKMSGRDLIIDDSELSMIASSLVFYFVDLYTAGDSTIAFQIAGSAGGELYWLDKNEPDILYCTMGMPGGFPNGIGYANIGEGRVVGVCPKTDAPVNEPKNGYMSRLRIRELADKYGFDPTLITDFGVVTENGTRHHDDRYYFFPMYLIKEEGEGDPKTLIFRTSVGDPYIDEERPGVTVTLEGYYGKWWKTVTLAGADAPPDDTLTDRELAEMEAVDNAIAELIETDDFKAMTLDEKREKAKSLLIQLATTGTPEFPYSLINERSIIYSEEGLKKFTFTYSCGALGGVLLEEFDSYLNGPQASEQTTAAETEEPSGGYEFSVITAPPEMTVVSSDRNVLIPAVIGSYSWSYKSGNAWKEKSAVSLHPLDPDFGALELPSVDVYLSRGGYATLSFGREPNEFVSEARCWSTNSIGSTADRGREGGVSKTNSSAYMTFVPPDKEDDYICRVRAEWDVSDKYKGSVEYIFRLNVIDDRDPDADAGDDHPSGIIYNFKGVMYKGKAYTPFPDRPLYTETDGIYYTVNETIIPESPPAQLSESALSRSDAIADILSHKSAGVTKLAEDPMNDLETDSEGLANLRAYVFEDGYEPFSDKPCIFCFTEEPVFVIDGLRLYQFAMLL